MDQCKPLDGGAAADQRHRLTAFLRLPHGRDLHSFPIPLDLSLLCPFPLTLSFTVPHITQPNPWMCPGSAQVELLRERCVPKMLKLSCEVSECKPLPHVAVSPG